MGEHRHSAGRIIRLLSAGALGAGLVLFAAAPAGNAASSTPAIANAAPTAALTGTVDRGAPDIAAPGTHLLTAATSSPTVLPHTAGGTIRCSSGCAVNVRSGPSTGYGVVGSEANGTQVSIYCTARGEWINAGSYGVTNLWDNIGGGHYISDALVYTGTSNPVAGDCGVSSGSNVNPFNYPWSGVGAGNYVADGYGYYEAECVSYSAWAVRSEGYSHSPNYLGNADEWNNYGVPTGGATAGSVPMWDDNHNGAGSLGHVAFVTAVFNDGTIQISEYNWSYAHGYDSRRISASNPSRYLHF